MSASNLWRLSLLGQEKFEDKGDLSDLDTCVDLYRSLLNDGEPSDENHPHEIYTRLSSALQLQSKFRSQPELLDEAIALAEVAKASCYPLCCDYPTTLSTLAAALRLRLNAKSDRSDLDDVLRLARASVEACSLEYLYRPTCLYELGRSLMSFCAYLRNLDACEQAIGVYREVLSIAHVSPYVRINAIAALADALWKRHINFGGLEYLDEAWIHTQEALGLRHASHALSWGTLNLASGIKYTRFIYTGALSDLEESAAIARHSLSVQPRTSLCIEALDGLAGALASKGELLANGHDLDEAIELQREAILLASLNHRSSDALAHNLGGMLGARYTICSNIADLDESLTTLRRALSLRSAEHPRRSATLESLGIILCQRYLELGDQDDIDEAILHHREALSFRSEGDPRYVYSLCYLGETLIHRDRDVSDLEEAISLLQQVIAMANSEFATSSRLHIVHALLKKHDFAPSLDTLEDAIRHSNEAVQASHDNTHLRLEAMSTLADVYCARYAMLRCGGADSDIHMAYQLYSNVVEEGTPYFHYVWNNRLAQLHAEPATPYFDLAAATRYAHMNIVSTTRSAQLRLKDAVTFLKRVHEASNTVMDRKQIQQLLTVYEATVQLLPQAAYFALDIKHRLSALRDAENISLRGSLCALSLSAVENALEILEQGRCIFWMQALRLRSPLDDVPQHLQEELRVISRRIEMRGYALGGEFDSKEDVEREASRNRRDTERFDILLREVRALPGFEGFLLHEPAERLVDAGLLGPIVVLLANRDSCYAITVDTNRQLRSIALRHVDDKWLAEASAAWGRLASLTRNDISERLGVSRRSEPRQVETQEKQILEQLWNKVVHPILISLGLKPQNGRDRPRVWWIPTGNFSFLPLHAAGTAKLCCSSYVVSSYVPTLTTLLNARCSFRPVHRHGSQIVLAAVPTAMSGASDLPQTVNEVRNIHKIVEQARTGQEARHDSRASNMVHVKYEVTVRDFLDVLPQTTILHLACHGRQDAQTPLESCFVLHDGPVSIATLMPLPLPQAFFAFLSACETAKGDEAQPDQLIHLAAAMLFAGFKSVVGTMWNMNDYDGPFVSNIVYQQLFAGDNDILDPDVIPYALDDAVQQLRGQGLSPSRWATYIHVGM